MQTVQTRIGSLPLDKWVVVENTTELEADLLLVNRTSDGVVLGTANQSPSNNGVYVFEPVGSYVKGAIFAYDVELASKNLSDLTVEELMYLTQDDTGLFGTNLVYGLLFERETFAKMPDVPYSEVQGLVRTINIVAEVLHSSLTHNGVAVTYIYKLINCGLRNLGLQFLLNHQEVY